jgi:hypothetical protein
MLTDERLVELEKFLAKEKAEWVLLKRWAAWLTIAVLVGLAVEAFVVFVIGGAK